MAAYVLFFFLLSSAVLEGYCLATDANITVSDYCIQETEVTKELVASYDNDPDKEPTEDYYCYLHCVFTTLGMIDENGAVQVELFKTLMEEEVDADCLKAAPNIVECNDMKALEKCEKKG